MGIGRRSRRQESLWTPTEELRRVIRGRENIFKGLMVHYAALNLALMMHQQFGTGAPRSLREGSAAYLAAQNVLFQTQTVRVTHQQAVLFGILISRTTGANIDTVSENSTSATGC